MGLKVVGAGQGRTGTHSLKLALEHLTGDPCYHMAEVFQHMDHCPIWRDAARGHQTDWHALMKDYGAAVDWPAAAFWKEMSEAFPDALILLSLRDPEEWWQSANSTIFAHRDAMPDPNWQEMIHAILDSRINFSAVEKEPCIEAFKAHNEDVLKNAPKDRLLVWQAGDGWEPICKALKLPVPDIPFPHSNSRKEFNDRIAARAKPLQA
jgi:hypothetical protein